MLSHLYLANVCTQVFLLAQEMNGESEIGMFCFIIDISSAFFSGRHPVRATEHYQKIKKSKHVKGFDVFIV